MKTIIRTILVFGIFLLTVFFVLADGDHQDEIEEGRRLVESGVSCNELSDEQLEAIGEYYMEQMHPGEAHEAMHGMMGIEEGTAYHDQFHINMARTMYCGNGGMMSGGMMNGGMMGMMPMMNMMSRNVQGGMMQGMMGINPMGYGYGYWNFWNIAWSLFWIGIIVMVIWLIYKFIIKKETETPGEILKKRYAKGEITKKQYEEIKKGIG